MDWVEVLKIPPEFDFADEDQTEDLTKQLELWKDASLQALLAISNRGEARWSEDQKVELLYVLAPFLSNEAWTSETHSRVANGE